MDQSEANPIKKLIFHRLSRRDYSHDELRRFLTQKGYGPDQFESVLKTLVQEGWINDERVARVWSRHWEQQSKGVRWIRLALLKKGIRCTEGQIQEWMENPDPSAEARRWVERRYAGFENDPKVAQRAFQALLRRGFSLEIARSVALGGRRKRVAVRED